MKHLRDYAKVGSVHEVQQNLNKLSEDLLAVATALFDRRDLDVGCRVYPAIARSTAEQLQLLAKHLEAPIEITANVCRTVFEINVVLRYCLSDFERLDVYATQAATDEISIYKSIKRLADETTDPKNLALLDKHINQIRSVLTKHGKQLKPDRPSLFLMAKEVGLSSEYDSMYGIYSKYVHASAWFVVRDRDQIDRPMYRSPMQLHSQLYAADTLCRLQELNQNTE